MKILIILGLLSVLQIVFSGDCDSDCSGPPEPPTPADGHPSNHMHSEDTAFLYQDEYVRVVEGETVKVCARLSHALDTEFEVEYFMEPLSAEEGGIDFPLVENYEYIEGDLTFEAGTTEKCVSFNTTDDDNAGEENIEFFYFGWYMPNAYEDEIYIYTTEEHDNEGFTIVSIEDNDVLTLTPNTTSVTVYEGDYSVICVTPDEMVRDSPALFYVLFDDKRSHGYTADIYHDLQYTHVDDYPHGEFYHYGGVYDIYPDQNETCFHFHTLDDDKFEGNEEFAIKLFSFTPLSFRNDSNDSEGNGGSHRHPFNELFHHSDFDDYFNDHSSDRHGHHHDHDDKDYEDFLEYFDENRAIYYSELLTFDTYIPEPLSTIHVTIVDNEPAPCPQENTAPCFQLMKDVMCMHLQSKAKSKHDVPRPCRRFTGGLLGSLQRHDPHPNRD